jgi:hypothetical protein
VKKLAKPSNEQNVWTGKQRRRASERSVRRSRRRSARSQNGTVSSHLEIVRERRLFGPMVHSGGRKLPPAFVICLISR